MDRRALIGLAALSTALVAEAAEASGKSEGGGGPANAYIPLPTATATILRRDGRRGVMTVEVGVDVADQASAPPTTKWCGWQANASCPAPRRTWNGSAGRFKRRRTGCWARRAPSCCSGR
jgi:hypothetical protein